jgi:hypothetical protein
MKYLFTALFADGKQIEQTDADTSKLDEKRSAFYDVLEEEKNGNKCWIFNLSHKEGDNINDYLMDLRDGHFEVNNAPLWLHAEDGLTDFRLIYYRNVRKIYEGFEEIRTEIAFNFGWQTTRNGENIQKVITLA